MAPRLTGLFRLSRRPPTRDAIPLADAGGLAAPARRTRLARLVLAGALVAVGVGTVASVPSSEGRRFFPADTVGVVVLDLSSSIRPNTYDLIADQLRQLSSTDQRFGLVLFSDVAYEALPPGTPARELRPFIRFFEPQRRRYDSEGMPIPRSPWEQWFSAGTAISSGLDRALALLDDARVRNGSVVLISDLADDPSDLEDVADTILEYTQRGISLRIVALEPSSEDRNFFGRLLDDPTAFSLVMLPDERRGRGRVEADAPFPTDLVLLASLAVVLLALNEYWARPFEWRRRERA
jgi:hypothetical protein